MSTLTLRDFLIEKSRDPAQKEGPMRKREWVEAVSRLMNRLRDWLAASDPEGVLEVVTVPVNKWEEGMPPYRVEGLEVSLGKTTVHILPVGRNVIGYLEPCGGPTRAEGRVDISNGGFGYLLYRLHRDGEELWYAVDKDAHATLLDQARFEAIMLGLLS